MMGHDGQVIHVLKCDECTSYKVPQVSPRHGKKTWKKLQINFPYNGKFMQILERKKPIKAHRKYVYHKLCIRYNVMCIYLDTNNHVVCDYYTAQWNL